MDVCPAAPHKEKREEKQADRKVPDRLPKKKKCVTKLTRNNKISDIFLISANQPSNIKFLTLQTNPSFLISSWGVFRMQHRTPQINLLQHKQDPSVKISVQNANLTHRRKGSSVSFTVAWWASDLRPNPSSGGPLYDDCESDSSNFSVRTRKPRQKTWMDVEIFRPVKIESSSIWQQRPKRRSARHRTRHTSRT
jgi:hypothetical protein